MDVYELVEKAGGEIVRGRARVRVGTAYVTVGQITPEGMVMTTAGKDMVDSLKPARKRGGGKKVTEAPPAVDGETPSDVQV